ncbi:MAG: methyltransferase domain-containing protein [Pyrinomonadaceae bacterium]
MIFTVSAIHYKAGCYLLQDAASHKTHEIMREMDLKEKLERIPRGNTCKGVNRLVIERLLGELPDRTQRTLLDVPCGNGEFLDTAAGFFPEMETAGADLREPVGDFTHRFIPFNGEKPSALIGERFDVVTCISGVMEFDNTLSFFEHVRTTLDNDGVFIVTNDNILSVRDRLMYLLSGRFGQYPFRAVRDGSAWKIVPAQNLVQLLDDAGFEVKDLEYVPVLGANWIWTVLALPLFLIQAMRKSTAIERKIFTLRSFLSRHYVIVCRPTTNREPVAGL